MSDQYVSLPSAASPRWKSPVANAAALPPNGNTDGDTRVTLNDKSIYVYNIGTNTWLEAATPAATSAITALNTDVTANGPGAAPATVNSVGGSTAAHIHSAELLANAATSANTASTIVKRDASGNFTAGTITASLTGNASGSAASFTGALVGDVTGTQGATVVSIVGGSSAANVHSAELLANAATSTNTPSTIVERDASGGFSAGRIISSGVSGVIPAGVLLQKGNQSQFDPTSDGLHVTNYDCATQTNAAGAFNGAGTGTKAFVGFNNYNNLAFSALTALSFNARNVWDTVSPAGNVSWNILSNFNSGVRTLADDYVNLVLDGVGQAGGNPLYYILTTSNVNYPADLTTGNVWKVVGGTGSITMTGTASIGTPNISALSNPSALTVGMFFRDTVGTTIFPEGTTILSINVGASTCVVSNNASANSVGMSLIQYGGIAPVNRTGTANGTTTVTAIANTADLLAGMQVTGSGVPANSYIVSLVANTSITLNNSVSAGSPTLSFTAIGKTGIPSNAVHCGISWTQLKALNPNGTFVNTTPTVAGGWTAADGGWTKNTQNSAFNWIQGSTSTTTARINVLNGVTINGDVYTFNAS